MPTSAKVQYGLKNIHLFPLTETVESGVTVMSYGTAVAFPGAVNLTLSKESAESDPFFADDSIYYLPAVQPKGYSGTLEMALLPASIRTAFMNYVKDSKDTIIELGEAATVYFGMTCEKTTDTGFIKKVFYKCAFGSPDFAGSTKEDIVTPGTESIPVTILPTTSTFEVSTGVSVPVISAYADENSNATVISSWHTTPHLPDFS